MPTGKPKNGNRLRRGEKLAIVAATVTNPSPSAVAKIFEVGLSTVKRLINDPNLANFADRDYDQAARIMSTVMLANSARAQEKVTDQGLERLNPVQLAVFSKINVEASRLLRDKPTSINQHQTVTDLAAATLDQLKKSLDVIDVEEVHLNDSLPTNNTTPHTPETSNTVDNVAKSS